MGANHLKLYFRPGENCTRAAALSLQKAPAHSSLCSTHHKNIFEQAVETFHLGTTLSSSGRLAASGCFAVTKGKDWLLLEPRHHNSSLQQGFVAQTKDRH